MSLASIDMTDVVFDLAGDSLPATYPFALWTELTQIEPALANDERIAVLPLRTAENDTLHLLPKRAKLVLRLPQELASVALGLARSQLDVAGNTLTLGAGKLRPLQSYPTLHAHLVAATGDEAVFMDEVLARLAELGIQAQIICGRQGQLSDDQQTISGFSLVLHDLKPESSLMLQCAGMGAARRYGCGVFVPYKVISSLE